MGEINIKCNKTNNKKEKILCLVQYNQLRQIYRRNHVAFGSIMTRMTKNVRSLATPPRCEVLSGRIQDSCTSMLESVFVGAVGGVAKVVSAVIKIPFKGILNLGQEARELGAYTRALSDSACADVRAQGFQRTADVLGCDLLSPFKKLAKLARKLVS
jgi:hypothetical protein